jgi:hypothetical protein
MNLQTKVEVPDYPFNINHQHKILMLGSCFVENIGKQLLNYKFNCQLNPFGILYNPLSIYKSIQRLVEKKVYTDADLFLNNDMWTSFDHHGSFSNANKQDCISKINDKLGEASSQLRNADYVFMTFGTARVYTYNKTKSVVANCHKIPAKEFTRRLISVDEIVHAISENIASIRELNPNAKFIFTVSPIRHWKDGAHGNQISKSTLLLAIEKIIEQNVNCFYFPVYEIFMDELRDYRFYAGDMLHPSEQAVNYIWEVFESGFINEASLHVNAQIKKINSAIRHRPINPDTRKHQSFLKQTLQKLNDLEAKHSELNFEAERKILLNQIN